MTSGPHAIVIFGAAVREGGQPSPAMQERVAAALARGRTLPDPLYLPTGGIVRHPPAEAELMRDLLVAGGVDPRRIRPDTGSVNTLRSVRACRAALGRFPGTVHAATSAYHMPRCLVLLRIAGLRAVPCLPERWRAHPYWWLREAAGVPADAVLALWWRRQGRFDLP